MSLSSSHFRQFAIAIVAMLALPAAAYSTPPFRQVGKSAVATQQHAAVLAQLHSAYNLLIRADHDYNGNRAKAAHEVSGAIHALTGHHHHHPGQVRLFGANIKNGMANPKMPQAQSDAHLKQAGQILASVAGKLPQGHKSSANVQKAIRHIQVALQIKYAAMNKQSGGASLTWVAFLMQPVGTMRFLNPIFALLGAATDPQLARMV